MKLFTLLFILPALTSSALAQTQVPNLGDKVCALWTNSIDTDKKDQISSSTVVMMDWWALGYLKGMATQYAYGNNTENPLKRLRGDDALEWMRAYCRVNKMKYLSDAALALLEELQARR